MLFRAPNPLSLPRRWAGRVREQPPVPKLSMALVQVQAALGAVSEPVGVLRGRRRGIRCRYSGEETKGSSVVVPTAIVCRRALLDYVPATSLSSAPTYFLRLSLASRTRIPCGFAAFLFALTTAVPCDEHVFPHVLDVYMAVRLSAKPREAVRHRD